MKQDYEEAMDYFDANVKGDEEWENSDAIHTYVEGFEDQIEDLSKDLREANKMLDTMKEYIDTMKEYIG